MNIVSMIEELEKAEYRGSIKQLLDFVVDGKYTPFQEVVSSCDTFFYNGQELLLYKENQIVYSANITTYCEQRFITTMYGQNGIVYDSHFEYDSEINRCLYDLFDLKQHCPETWMYNLVEIYDQYGVDTVNTARWLYCY